MILNNGVTLTLPLAQLTEYLDEKTTDQRKTGGKVRGHANLHQQFDIGVLPQQLMVLL